MKRGIRVHAREMYDGVGPAARALALTRAPSGSRSRGHGHMHGTLCLKIQLRRVLYSHGHSLQHLLVVGHGSMVSQKKIVILMFVIELFFGSDANFDFWNCFY